jgi:uncharacterized damage-inducible protein DinB
MIAVARGTTAACSAGRDDPVITGDYLLTMARYNRWQNGVLYAAADTLSDADRKADRGAFWKSIHGTLSHLYWADRIWLSRFNVVEPPNVQLKTSPEFIAAWSELKDARSTLDDAVVRWADAFEAGVVQGELTWFSGAIGREVTMPLGVVIVHIFNHQTHHRGQAHAMITAAGAKTADTDLFVMPPDLWPAHAARTT